MSSKKQELYNSLDLMCLKCLIRFGYWMIKTTEDSSNIVNREVPGLFQFTPAMALELRNSFIGNAIDGEASFKSATLKVIWNIPDLWPEQWQALAYQTIERELQKAITYCKGDNNVAHSDNVAMKMNLGSMKAKTIGWAEARPNKTEEKRIWVKGGTSNE